MKNYIGNSLQVRGVMRYVLQGGRGDGMHFVNVRNGLGLDVMISQDRCADLAQVTFKGDNMGFLSACGYVAPQYYDPVGAGFLKSFSGGFFTTCGLTAVGSPCVDDGEDLPLHGTISNTPAQLDAVLEDEEGVKLMFTVCDSGIFARKLVLKREYYFSYKENFVSVSDEVINEGDTESPFMILYHCNMGYPLLDEDSVISIPNNSVTPRNEHAKENIVDALSPQKPEAGYEECCFYYDVKDTDGKAAVSIYNPKIERGVQISYNKEELPFFTQWKMMGKKDYVMGLEPGNCSPDGRDVMRKEGKLRFIAPGESAKCGVRFDFTTKEI